MTINLPNLSLLAALTDDFELSEDATNLDWRLILEADVTRWSLDFSMAGPGRVWLSTNPTPGAVCGWTIQQGDTVGFNAQTHLSKVQRAWYMMGDGAAMFVTVAGSQIKKQSIDTSER